ncbi:MAG: DUF5710 domain-containing protein [Pseudomonadota bacterium]
MMILKVPYAEKDQAKALGARWNKERKVWYVPDGTVSTPFERWIVPGANPAAPGKASGAAPKEKAGKVDSYVGKRVVGANYLELPHDCNPFIACEQCGPALAASGWKAAHAAVAGALATLDAGR